MGTDKFGLISVLEG